MSMYQDAREELEAIIAGPEHGRAPFTTDQDLKIVEVRALLAIVEELRRIRKGADGV